MREKRYDERKKWRILYAIVIAALLIGSGLMISAELISERDNFHSSYLFSLIISNHIVILIIIFKSYPNFECGTQF